MGPLDLLIHLSGFAAPALAVGLLVAMAGRVFGESGKSRWPWWIDAALNIAAGLGALIASLWYFGVDGKMAGYAALVVACATSQWLAGRNGR